MSLSIQETEQKIIVNILNQTLEIDPSVKEYQKFIQTVHDKRQLYYDGLMEEVLAKKDSIQTFNGFTEEILPIYFDYMERFPSVGIDVLQEYGVSDVPLSTLEDRLTEDRDQVIHYVADVYQQISLKSNDYAAQKQYDHIEIPSIGFRGYGYGVKGALKLSALNFGTALMTSLGNSIATQAMQKDILNQVDKIYRSFNVPKYLDEELNHYFSQLNPILADIFVSRNILPPSPLSLNELQAMSDEAYKWNQKVLDYPQEPQILSQADAAWLKIICKLPNQASAYFHLYKLHKHDPEAVDEIQKLADYFGVSSAYQGYIILDLRRELNRIAFYTPDTSLEELKKILRKTTAFVEQNPNVKNDLDNDPDQIIAKLKQAIERKEHPSNGCFITSAVCKSFHKPDDCYELTAFRAFRDDWLKKQPDGADLIQEYYQIAPEIVTHIDTSPDCNAIYLDIWNTYLEPCLRAIEDDNMEHCKSVYTSMVRTLQKQYLK